METTLHAQVLKLRHDGYNVQEISAKVGISPIRCHVIIADAITELQDDSTKHAASIREVELLRLETATKALMPGVIEGNIGHINTLLKVQDRRAKFIGLDSAIKQDTTITIEVPWLTRDRLAYKDQIEDATVISSPADLVQVEHRASSVEPTPIEVTNKGWKSPPPSSGLAHILREDEKLGDR